MADYGTDQRLLPEALQPRSNTKQKRWYRTALLQAVKHCLSPQQRDYILLHYWKGKSKTEIAALRKVGYSQVCKSIRTALEKIDAYVNLYLDIYQKIRKELLEEEE